MDKGEIEEANEREEMLVYERVGENTQWLLSNKSLLFYSRLEQLRLINTG